MISGAALIYKYDEILNIKEFYEKRIKSIYPMFFIAYFMFFMFNFYNSLQIPDFPKTRFIFTLLGIDGYLLYKIPNFYLIGEWFLGAIIVIYLLYPLLNKVFNKNPKLTILILGILNCIIILFNPFEIEANRNILVCLFSFSLGMFSFKYIKEIDKTKFIILIIISICIIFLKTGFNEILMSNILGYILFFILRYISDFIKQDIIKEIICIISKYSYAIFLVHHFIIIQIMQKFVNRNLSVIEVICLFMLCASITGIASKIVYNLNKSFLKIIKNKNRGQRGRPHVLVRGGKDGFR